MTMDYLVRRIGFAQKGNIMATLSNMRLSKQITVIGTAAQAKLPDVYRDALVYAVPGTAKLPELEVTALSRRKAKQLSQRPAGSGVITPPPYRTGLRWGLL